MSEAPEKHIRKHSLGRGLGSLLGQSATSTNATTVVTKPSITTPQIPETARIWQISIDKLSPQPNQPRKVFKSDTLNELAASIKAQGILQPIVARRKGTQNFEIIAGERRWRAAQIAGLHEVPVILQNIGDQKSLELALIENIQRQDLNPLEEALAYSHLLETYSLTQQQLSEKVGKERVTIANTLRILQLSPDVREWVGTGELSLGQAKVLLGVTDVVAQKNLAQKIIREKLSVRAAEKLIAKHLSPDTQQESKPVAQSIKVLNEELQKIVGSKVTIDYILGKGRVSLHFYSDDELNEITDRMRRSWQKPKV